MSNEIQVQPVLFGSVEELFRVADTCKRICDYTSANIIFAFIFDWLVGQSSLDENDGERDNIRLEYETDHGDPHYDLCVMVYVGEFKRDTVCVESETDHGDPHHIPCVVMVRGGENELRLNIPAPLLTKKALCCFFRDGAEIVERQQHGREHEEREPIDITTFGVVDPGWVLESAEGEEASE